MPQAGLPTPLAVMHDIAQDCDRDDMTRLKSYCDLAESTARLLAAIAVADCRRLALTTDRLSRAVGRIATTGLQFGHWTALLEAGCSALRKSRDKAVPEIAGRARAWGGRQYGYLDWLGKLHRARNYVHHSSLQTDPGELREQLHDAELLAGELLECVDFLQGYRLVAREGSPETPDLTVWRGPEGRQGKAAAAEFEDTTVPERPGTYLIGATVPLILDPLVASARCPECGRWGTFSLDRYGTQSRTTFIAHLCPHRVDLPAQHDASEALIRWAAAAESAPRPAAKGPKADGLPRRPTPAKLKVAAVADIVSTAVGPTAGEHFRQLTDEQLEAVTYMDGPSLVLAPAGTGKTLVLASKAVWLTCRDVPPASILAVTFTNRAAREMRERLELMWGRTPPIRVGTVHATCCTMLRETEGRVSGVPPGFTIADGPASDDLLRAALDRVLEKRGGHQVSQKVRANIQGLVRRAKEALLEPSDLRNQAGTVQFADLAADVYHRYQCMLAARGWLDFSDLIGRACHALAADPAVLEHYRARWQWILVDEYQDLNDAQVRWIELLRGDSPRFFVAGDDDQMIYGWRGARPERVEDLLRAKGTKVFKLTSNFRSTRRIQEAATALISRNQRRVPKQMRFGFAAEGQPVIAHEAVDENDEAEWIAERIAERAMKDPTNGKAGETAPQAGYGSQAIFARTWGLLEPIAATLKHRGIPHRILAARGADDPFVRVAFAALGCAAGGHNAERLLRSIQGLFPGTDPGQLRTLLETAAGLDDGSASASGERGGEAPGPEPGSLGVGHGGGIAAFVGDLLTAVEGIVSRLDGQDCATAAVEALLGPLQSEGRRRGSLLEESASALDDLYLAALEYDQDRGKDASVADFVSHLALRAADRDEGAGGDEVTLMTIHTAKGLEFPVVYLAGTCSTYAPFIPDAQRLSPSELAERREEERRLFYVGMMRAKEQLVISYPARRRSQTTGRTYVPSPSPFLGDLGRRVIWV